MKENKNILLGSAVRLILERMAEMSISQVELASRSREHVQTISAIINGKREIPLPLSIRLDAALGLKSGSLALAQTKDNVEREIQRYSNKEVKDFRDNYLQRIKAAGGFWSYSGIPEHIDDDSIIEAALVHLELEELPDLLTHWSKSHIKRVWKERLVSQGKRMNILNYILAVQFFKINKPDSYLTRYAN